MKIEVTQQDIDAGKRSNCRQCPIALAVQRAFPAVAVSVSVNIYVLTDDGLRTSYILPWSASQFMVDFDSGLPVQPFTFEI